MPNHTVVREKKVHEERESSVSTSSSSLGIHLDSLGYGGRYGDDEHAIFDTIEHLPDAIDIDPLRGYVRHVPQTEPRTSSSAAGQGGGCEGECTSRGDLGQQQAMYGYFPD